MIKIKNEKYSLNKIERWLIEWLIERYINYAAQPTRNKRATLTILRKWMSVRKEPKKKSKKIPPKIKKKEE